MSSKDNYFRCNDCEEEDIYIDVESKRFEAKEFYEENGLLEEMTDEMLIEYVELECICPMCGIIGELEAQ